MQRVTFGTEKDRVILSFPERGNTLRLLPYAAPGFKCDAERFAEEVERQADHCERWMKAGGKGELNKGKWFEVSVMSWDGFVNVTFKYDGDTGLMDRVSIPYKFARTMAKMVRNKITEARFRVHIPSFPMAYNTGTPLPDPQGVS